MARIRIPSNHQPHLRHVQQMSPAAFDQMLANIGPGILPGYVPMSQLIDSLADSVPDPEAAARAFLGLTTARWVHDDDLDTFVRLISEADEFEVSADGEREEFAARLKRLLLTPSIATTAKALDIASDHERRFHAGRIFTEVRPVFGDDAKAPPAGAVVIHQLKIESFSGNQTVEHFVALDSNDLLKLKATVDRAVDKANSLTHFLGEIGFECFTLEAE